MHRGIRPAALLTAYVALGLMPLALAAWQDLPPRPFLDDLSSALAMVGFSMLLMEFVLSGRFRSVSGQAGIDVTMRFHQLIARGLAIFILVHPFLYTLPMSKSLPWDTSGQETLGLSGAALLTGGVAWLLLPVLVLLAVFRREAPYKYETWRLMHGVGAALIALLTLHHALEAGRYSGHDGLAGFWVVMTAGAFLTLLYVYALRPLLQLRHPYRVASVKPVARKTWELVIEPERGDAADFEAGQFVWLNLGHSPFTLVEHPFSVSSAPAERPRLGFLIKEAGDFTDRIGSTPVGTRAHIDGPHGHLVLPREPDAGIVFLAGGVGLAPVISMLRQLRAEQDSRSLRLVYANRIAEQIAYGDELEDMSRELDLEVIHVLSEPPPDWQGRQGIIDEPLLRELRGAGGHDKSFYVVCGPAPMIDSVADSLRRVGVPPSRIVSEKLSYD